jgi:hypothetical protein
MRLHRAIAVFRLGPLAAAKVLAVGRIFKVLISLVIHFPPPKCLASAGKGKTQPSDDLHTKLVCWSIRVINWKPLTG